MSYPPPEYVTMSRELLDDFKRFAVNSYKRRLTEELEQQLYNARTTSVQDGLELALTIIEEIQHEA